MKRFQALEQDAYRGLEQAAYLKGLLNRSSSPFFSLDLPVTLAVTGFQLFFDGFRPPKCSH
jgi:hypothetical protein